MQTSVKKLWKFIKKLKNLLLNLKKVEKSAKKLIKSGKKVEKPENVVKYHQKNEKIVFKEEKLKSAKNWKKSFRPPFLDFFTSFLHFFQISNCWTGNVSWLRPTRVFVSYHWQPESGIQNLQSVLSLFLAIFWVHTFCQYLFVSFEYISLANFILFAIQNSKWYFP